MVAKGAGEMEDRMGGKKAAAVDETATDMVIERFGDSRAEVVAAPVAATGATTLATVTVWMLPDTGATSHTATVMPMAALAAPALAVCPFCDIAMGTVTSQRGALTQLALHQARCTRQSLFPAQPVLPK